MTKTPSPKAAPRLDSLDIVRGMAVLGILVMNLQSFALPQECYVNPLANGLTSLLASPHGWSYLLAHLLADQKFVTLFSLLFGTSLAMLEEKRGQAYLLRRNLVLMGLGLAHALLLWHGDILVTYAVTALLLLPLIKLDWKRQVTLGSVFLGIPVLLNLLIAASLPYWPILDLVGLEAYWWPSQQQLAEQVQVMQGSYLGQFQYRVPAAVGMWTLLPYETGWRVAGLALWGSALHKTGFFRRRPRPEQLAGALYLGGLGLTLTALGVAFNMHHGWSALYSPFFGAIPNYLGSLLQGFSYLLGLVWLAHYTPTWPPLQWFRNCGRLSLSNYLFQSFVGTLIFYGHGFGFYAQLQRPQLLLVLVLIWSLQIRLSTLWLQHHPQGPVERLWRRLTDALAASASCFHQLGAEPSPISSKGVSDHG